MPVTLSTALAFVVLALFVIYVLWTVVPILSGLPWRPAGTGRIRKALQMAGVKPGEMVYDLGSGDGRVLLIAAREFQARAIGIEIGPLHRLVSRLLAWLKGVNGQVKVYRGDFYTANLPNADVVFAYMTSKQAARLKINLENRLRGGARVVTISFDLDGWEPQAVDRDELIFLYTMPPQPGSLETYLAKHL